MALTKVDSSMFASGVVSKIAASTSASYENQILRLGPTGEVPSIYMPDTVALEAQSAEPSAPLAGNAVLWLSDGIGPGDTGDLMAIITRSPTTATYVNAVDFSGFTINDSFTITVPANAGGTGVAFTVMTEGVDATGSVSAGANRIAVGCSTGPSAGTVAETVVDAINGHYGSGGAYNHSFASANTGIFTAAGVTAALSGSTAVTLTSTYKGTNANSIAVANVVGNAATDGSLSGALDAATKSFTVVDYSA